ncbi:hypothetical protein FRB90_010643, partial [Tulasnella sp. 427]
TPDVRHVRHRVRAMQPRGSRVEDSGRHGPPGARRPGRGTQHPFDGYAKQRIIAATSKIYALLSGGGHTPDLFAHTTMINSLFQEGAVDDAMSYFKKAEQLFAGEWKKGIHVATYNAVDRLLNPSSKPCGPPHRTSLGHHLKHLPAALRPQTRRSPLPAKVPANTATYTAIIDCLIWRRGEQSVRAALQLLDKMEGDGVHTKEATFTSLLAGVSRADYLHPEVQSRLVDEIMSMMCARGMDPNCVTRNFLLLDARKTDGILGTDKAMKLWRETIAEKGGGISHTTYFVLLSGLAKNGKYNYCTISLIPAVPCPDPPAGP